MIQVENWSKELSNWDFLITISLEQNVADIEVKIFDFVPKTQFLCQQKTKFQK